MVKLVQRMESLKTISQRPEGPLPEEEELLGRVTILVGGLEGQGEESAVGVLQKERKFPLAYEHFR